MDQLPRGNEGFPNSNLFADNQQYNAYDNLFPTGVDQSSYDASWGLNASNYPAQSRAPHASAPGWPQNANHHLSAPPAHGNINGQPSSYSRSLSHSPSPYGQNAFNGYAAPQNFYRQPQYDPALAPSHAFNQNFNYSNTDYQIPNAGTIAPHALQQQTRSPSFTQNSYTGSAYQLMNAGPAPSNNSYTSDIVNPAKLIAAIPKGKNGGRFSIIDFNELADATNSERMGSFLNIGTEAWNWDANRAALPHYAPRKSRNELRKLAAADPKVLARLGKKTLKTFKKEKKLVVSAPKPVLSSAKGILPVTEKIKYEQESASEESSSSDDDDESSYTSDDADESSPLPPKRPDKPREATEYDTIKALWRGRRRALDSATIRKGLGEFWEIVKTIRDRWKLDVVAVQDAETKNRTNELPLLNSRVKDQRDMLEAAFKAALKHGHRGILELMSENVPLLFLCYQFLLDRAKNEDYNGALPRAILETISTFTTLTDEKLEKTHMIKVLPRFVKKGDAKTQFYAKRITANAAAAPQDKVVDDSAKKTRAKENQAPSPAGKRAEPEPVAGVKRSASTATDGGAQKKVATGAVKANGVSTVAPAASTIKKATTMLEARKPTPITAAAATAAKPKQVVAKPSGLFSSLQSAAKKPGTSTASKATLAAAPTTSARSAEKMSTSAVSTNQNAAPTSTFSFAETMKNLSKPKEEKPVAKPEKQLPSETTEEKAKRLRKESRRHLHVQFKPQEELVEVHIFHHDPEEEIGHDASQVRDVADVGGEGRMFKQQHHMMDIDDEDDVAEEEEEELAKFEVPKPIDFSDVDPEERKRNYVQFAGGDVEPESAEKAVREHHEANTLIVFYTDASDIPPNPREPADPYNGENVTSVKTFGRPEEKWAARARQKTASLYPHQKAPQQFGVSNNAAQGYDFSKIAEYTSLPQNPAQGTFSPPTQPAAPSYDAINNILASLKPAQATPPVPTMGGFGATYTAPQPPTNTFQPPQPLAPPNGQPDLAAILAQIQQTQPAPQQPPPMGSFNFSASAAVPNMSSYAPQMQQPNVYENPERKQWREGGSDHMSRAKKQGTGQNPYFRTKVCKYWQEGRCQKGDQCSYKHED